MDYIDSSDDDVLKSLLFDDSDNDSDNNNNTYYNQLLSQSNVFQKRPRPTYVVRNQLEYAFLFWWVEIISFIISNCFAFLSLSH